MAYRIIDRDNERCSEWLGDSTRGSYDMLATIGLERDGELVAVAGYNQFTPKSCAVHFSIDKGIYPPRNFIWFVHYYPFVQAGVNVMLAMVRAENQRIIKLAEHLGYTLHCKIDEAGLLLYGLSKQNCKWIGINYGRK